MPKNTMNSLPTTETAVHFHRLIFGGLVALLPALMAAKGCAVAEIGSDERVCGGLEALSCDAGEFCKYSDDSCSPGDETGVCEPVPEVCGEIYAPVCDCNGETYDNECLADAARAFIAFEGACDQPSDVCGPMEEECGEGEFCKYPISASCGTDTEAGVCTPKPETCTLDDVPVCGCDGETYSNACEADAEGVSVASDGECDQPSKVCGGWTSEKCDEGEFCNYPLDAMCGVGPAVDATGTCEPIPDACDDNYDPVCGCDGATHSNECNAHMAGTPVAYAGECFEEGQVCGGLVGGLCEEGEFCNIPLERSCGGTDESGLCEPIPEGCTTDYDPVCGCDGETYGNECEARAASVSIQALGECNE